MEKVNEKLTNIIKELIKAYKIDLKQYLYSTK